ncbi:MAG: MBL fold metallo-hydrolase [Chloroflexota bacterium]
MLRKLSLVLGCLLVALLASCQASTTQTAPAKTEAGSPVLKPALFVVSDLSVSPSEVVAGSPVTIEVTVTNQGELSGTYAVTFKIDGIEVGAEQVTLKGGASTKVRFTGTKSAAATYLVTVNGQSGRFVVKEQPKPIASPPPSAATPALKVKYLAHSCFLITSESGTKIITDPYLTGGELTYGEVGDSADIVTVSHEHSDHNNTAAVGGSPQVVSRASAEVNGIKFRAISTFHDTAQGTARGRNTVYCFEVSGLKICHLGDLGHLLSEAQVSEIGAVDILLIPVGGTYTINAPVATQICDQLKPKVVIPMHYLTDKCSYPIANVDEFLKGKSGMSQPGASEVEFKAGQLPASAQIIVLTPAR